MRVANVTWVMIGTLFATVLFSGFTAVEKNGKENSGIERAELLVRQQASAVRTMHEFIVSHQVDVKSVTPKFDETTHAYLTTWVKHPDLLRIRSQMMRQGKTIVADGHGMWIYRDADRVYWRQPGKTPAGLMESAFPGLGQQLSDVNLPKVMTSASIVGEENLEIGHRRFPCTIVDVMVTPNAADGTLENNHLRLWISTAYKVPLKVKAAFTPAGGTRKVYTDFATLFDPEAKIARSTWTFVPPEGSKLRPATPVPGSE